MKNAFRDFREPSIQFILATPKAERPGTGEAALIAGRYYNKYRLD